MVMTTGLSTDVRSVKNDVQEGPSHQRLEPGHALPREPLYQCMPPPVAHGGAQRHGGCELLLLPVLLLLLLAILFF